MHRWSEHPRVREVTERIWELGAFQPYRKPAARGPKPKRRFKDQLHVLVLDLYVAWKTDPTLSIGVSMRRGGWKTNFRYNALHLSNVIPELVHALEQEGLIVLSKGSYSGPNSRGNRTSRIIAARPLQEMFEGVRVPVQYLEAPAEQELIVLRDADGKDIEYEDTPEIIGTRDHLRNYNELLWSSFIDCPGLEDPRVEIDITDGPLAGTKKLLPVGGRDYCVRRVFSRSSWQLNGRLYGGWWQQLPKEYRRQIHIEDEPTVEVDFRGLHVAILSKEKGVLLEGDPYDVGALAFPEECEDQRSLLKLLVLTAINAGSENAAFSSFRSTRPTGHPSKKLTNDELRYALGLFVRKHPQLEDCLCSDQGIRLMFEDSEIAFNLVCHLYQDGIVVLPIHDSFIVQCQHLDRLLGFMADTTTYLTGTPFPVSIERGEIFPDPLYDEVLPGQREKTLGYHGRYETFLNRDRWKEGIY